MRLIVDGVDPFKLREIEFKNRIVVSPMCEYSAKEGHPQPWHMVHLGSRAVGGAALVFTEATAVQDIGRISAQDAGIYEDAHIASWRPIAEFIRANGAIAGMQLAHAGRKGSTAVPWAGGENLHPPRPLLPRWPEKLRLVRLTPHPLNLALLTWCS